MLNLLFLFGTILDKAVDSIGQQINHIMKSQLYLLSILALFVFSTSCEKVADINDLNQENSNGVCTIEKVVQPTNTCGVVYNTTFKAGQNINAGEIIVWNTEDSVFVQYSLANGWKMSESHLYIGTLAGMPKTSTGNPKIGNFPVKRSYCTPVSTVTFGFKASSLPECFIVAAHGVVKKYQNGQCNQEETAWGDGTQITSKGSWASYFDYCFQECCSINTQNYTLFAGQNTNIGNLEVTNDEDNLYVTYSLTGNWYLNETQLYVGYLEDMPTNNGGNPQVGLFPFKTTHSEGVNSYTYTIPLSTMVDDCYIIAAHASVSQVVNGQEISSETAWSYGNNFPYSNQWGWYSNYCTQSCNENNGGGGSIYY